MFNESHVCCSLDYEHSMAQLSAVVNMWWTVSLLALNGRQMAAPFSTTLWITARGDIRSRYALAPHARRFAQWHTEKTRGSGSERSERHPMGVLRTILNKI